MRRWTKAMTYKPKLDPVFEGRCTQTIRKDSHVEVGDTILFHEWTGKPYRSPWGRRLLVTVTEVIDVIIANPGIFFSPGGPWAVGIVRIEKADGTQEDRIMQFNPWEGDFCDQIARLDFIDPPTGIALRDVLRSKNPHFEGEYQIIRWIVNRED